MENGISRWAGNLFRRRPTRSGAASGFTLTEVLVSMLVLTAGCMAVISMQASGMNAGDRAGSLAVASFLAESQAEWLQTMDLNKVQFSSSGPEALAWDGSPCETGERCFNRTVKTVCYTPTKRSCEVSITVEWKAASGNHKLVYDTVVSDFGF